MEPTTTFQTSAKLFKADNTTKRIDPANGIAFSRDELRQIIGGDYEYWTLPTGCCIVAKSDTMMDTTPRNEPLYKEIGIAIVGTAIICPQHAIPSFQ